MRPLLTTLVILIFISSCGGDEDINTPGIELVSITIDGANVSGTLQDVSVTATISLTFNSSLSSTDFEDALSIASNGVEANYTVSYQNASSKAVIETDLAYNTSYAFRLLATSIGANGEALSTDLTIDFETQESEIITSAAPCGSASIDCTQSVSFGKTDEEGVFNFFSNYSIYLTNARWENLTSAVIVMHGVNRNSDDYFNWMTTTLEAMELDESTVLLAPSFKISSEAATNELYWNSSEWREGANSKEGLAISSFEVVDELITQLSNKDHFPVLEKIIVTGHSSGALYTHAYSAANTIDDNSGQIEITYVVANSQYFYYPSDERVNESNDQLYTPTGCGTFNFWPLGYNSVPEYVSQTSEVDLNNQFNSREIIYLLGNGTAADPSLNTTDCSATLLGSSRFNRGSNMFTYMELKFPGTHTHQKYLVEGIGHDGQGMYQSDEFKTLLTDLLNE